MRKQLVQSEKIAALGKLVAGVAHEVNTPVGNALICASHLKDKTKEFIAAFHNDGLKRSDMENYLETAVNASEMTVTNLGRAAQLIRDFKQIAVDQTTDKKRTFYLKKCVEGVFSSLRLRKTDYTVTFSCPDNLTLNSFPGPLTQVITNLVQNSINHGFDKDDKGKISISVSEEGEKVLIHYFDNGKGMSPEVVKRIYEPFFTTKLSKVGCGLGMSIVYNILTTLLDGTIECKSVLGQGTEFFIRISKNAKEKEYVKERNRI